MKYQYSKDTTQALLARLAKATSLLLDEAPDIGVEGKNEAYESIASLERLSSQDLLADDKETYTNVVYHPFNAAAAVVEASSQVDMAFTKILGADTSELHTRFEDGEAALAAYLLVAEVANDEFRKWSNQFSDIACIQMEILPENQKQQVLDTIRTEMMELLTSQGIDASIFPDGKTHLKPTTNKVVH